MNWFWFALLASLAWSTVQVVDKALINNEAPSTNHYLVASGAAALIPVALMPLLLAGYVSVPGPSALVGGAAAGVAYFMANALFFRALLHMDASLSSAGLAAVPGLTAIGSWLVLSQELTWFPVAGIVTITIGVVVMSQTGAGTRLAHDARSWAFLATAILLYVVEYVIEGALVADLHAMNVFFWTRVGVVGCTAALALVNIRLARESVQWAFLASRRVGSLAVSNEMLDMVAISCLITAYATGPVGLSTAVAYTQAAFVFGITLTVNGVRPGTIATRDDQKGMLGRRIGGLGIVLVGVLLTTY